MPKPYILSGDPDAGMVERIDDMLRELYELSGATSAHNLLSALHSDTTPADPSAGAMIVGVGTKWTKVAPTLSGTFPRFDGSNTTFAAVILTSDVAGTLPVTHGGTGIATVVLGDVLYASAADTLARLAKDANATRYLSNTGAGNIPAWARVDLTNGVTGALPSTNGGTGQTTYTTGAMVYYGGTVGQLDKLALGSNNQFLQAAAGVGPVWSAFALPAGVNQGDLLFGSSSTAMAMLAKDTTATRYLSNTGASNSPAWAQINLANGVISGTGRVTAQAAAAVSVATFAVGAADASYLVSADVLITASTTHSFTVTVSYTDEGNTARVLTLNFSQLTGTLVTTLTNALGVGPYSGVPVHIRAKASTSITIATTGTFTTVTYNAEGRIIQF